MTLRAIRSQLARSPGAAAGVALTTVVLSVRVWRYVSAYATNMLFWDQWDFLEPAFNEQGLWAQFFRQHGPHRQGAGALIHALVFALTDWDSRVEAFVVCAVVIAAALMAWVTKVRLTGRVSWWDCLIPLVVLTLHQGELFFAAVNPAHGAVPLLLFFAGVFALSSGSARVRLHGVALAGALSVFTGFGVFFGVLSVPVVLWQAISTRAETRVWERALSVCGSVGACLLFTHDYHFNPAVECFQFPHPRPLEYLNFGGLFVFERLTGVMQVAPTAMLWSAGFVAYAALGFVALWFAAKRRREVWVATALAFAVCTTFAMFSAVGRVCVGFDGATAARYAPYASIGLWGLYVCVCELTGTEGRLSSGIFGALLALLLAGETHTNRTVAAAYAGFKDRWAACYRDRGNIEECDALAGHPMHPVPSGTRMQQKLDWLKQRRLNLFKR